MSYMSDAEFAEEFKRILSMLNQEVVDYHFDLSGIINEPTMLQFTVQSGTTGKPRASSIAGCGAQQWYALTDQPKTDDASAKSYDFIEDSWAAWMGFAGEAITRTVLSRMGYILSSPDVYGDCMNCHHPVQTEDECVLCDCDDHDAIMTGHVDDAIEGLDLPFPHVWDNKVRNAFSFQKLLVADSVKSADRQMYGQMQTYMRFLDMEGTMITVNPHDSSTTRNNLTRRKEPIPIDSVVVFRKFIPADYDDQNLLLERAGGLNSAIALDIRVEREYDPDTTYFPCGWCPWKQRCRVDAMEGGETIELPPIPDSWGD